MQLSVGGKKIKFQTELDGATLLINADVQQMEQALINIVKNVEESDTRDDATKNKSS